MGHLDLVGVVYGQLGKRCSQSLWEGKTMTPENVMTVWLGCSWLVILVLGVLTVYAFTSRSDERRAAKEEIDELKRQLAEKE